jgi:hypothetical protein
MSRNNEICNFFIYENGLLIYSKYNFNWVLYIADNLLDSNMPKYQIFNHFLDLNETDLTKPYALKNNLQKYFNQITDEIRQYVSKYGVILPFGFNKIGVNFPVEFMLDKQFDLYPFNDNTRVCDFALVNLAFNTIDFKYLFKFDQYISEFKIIDNKITVFTDFLYRNYKLSSDERYTQTFRNLIDGYVIQNIFQRFFIFNDALNPSSLGYALLYGVTNNNGISNKNIDNIDYDDYIKTNNINIQLSDAKEYFLTTGQFQQQIIKFYNKENQNIININRAVATVYTKTISNQILNMVSGFLHKDVYNNIYLITTHNIFYNNTIVNYIYGIFESGPSSSFIAQFKVIGYDKILNILVSQYDKNLPYNKLRNPNFDNAYFVDINYDHLFYNTETVYIKGNIGLYDNGTLIKTNIINKSYSGGFGSDSTIDITPESLLLDTTYYAGLSGSPILIGDINIPNSVKIAGMVVGALSEKQHLTLGIKHYILYNTIISIIARNNLLTNYGTIEIINTYTDISQPRSWLGITVENNHPFMSQKYPELSNLPYVGGLLMTNIISGFNKKTMKFVYSAYDLSDVNTIPLYGPIDDRVIYDRFIKNSNVPLVIKSIVYYDNIYNEPTMIYFGKFGTQQPFSRFVYGQRFSNIYKSDPKYFNPYTLEFMSIRIYYYYYDGSKWIEDFVSLGNNRDTYYVDYKDNAGNLIHLHKFEYPSFLDKYINPYSLSNNNGHNKNIIY